LGHNRLNHRASPSFLTGLPIESPTQLGTTKNNLQLSYHTNIKKLEFKMINVRQLTTTESTKILENC